MILTLQETLLPGTTPDERFRQARALGMDGVEVAADALAAGDEALFAYAAAVDATGVPIRSLTMGARPGLLSLNTSLRDATIDRVRQALTDAHDLRVPFVTVVPQPAHAPQEASAQQEYEMMIWFVRVVNDLAGAMNTQLLLLPLPTGEARVLTTLAAAHDALAEMRFHPWVALSATLDSLHNDDEGSVASGILPKLRQVYLRTTVTAHHDPSAPAMALIRRLSAAQPALQWTLCASSPLALPAQQPASGTLRAWVERLRQQSHQAL